MQKVKQIAVVGSGFGGLAAAIRLQTSGHQVALFEMRDKPGGRAYVYQEKGYTFDAGPTVITAPLAIEELFENADRKMKDYVTLLPVNPFYRLFWEDGFSFDYSNDLQATLQQIRNSNTKTGEQDAKGYLEFLQYSERVFAEGYTKLAHIPFLNWSSMLKVAPQLIKLRADRSVYKTVSKYISEPHLREAFSFHSLLVGGNPFSTSSIYTLIHFLERNWGVFFPRGGTGALVQALVRLFCELGGKIHLNSKVKQIITQANSVKGLKIEGHAPMNFDAVVSNSDVVHTYLHLLQDTPSAKKQGERLAKAKHSMSLFLIYFGARKRWPELAHHNVIFGPRYKELLKDIFHRGVLAEDFSLYLHAPSVSDRNLAPEGCEAFYVLSPVPHLGLMDVDWNELGPKYAERILNYLDQRYLPGLKDNLEVQRIFTPQNFASELGTHLGAAFSLEPILTQSAFFRVHNRDDRIKGLYFVGAGTHPGAGVPGVLGSAKATSNLINQDLLPL